MRWSWKVIRIAGIDVYMHLTFLILLVWVALSSYQPHQSVREALEGTLFILILFSIVVLHELGHALTARRFGIATRDITLLPIGGVARLERMPEDPKQELAVALAGPAVNLVLAVTIWLLPGSMQVHPSPSQIGSPGGPLLEQLFWINVILALFNLIPAFPMDGGRVLRALLAIRIDYLRATEIAAAVGQSLAFLFGFIGLFANPFLVLVALFVWMGAAQESNLVALRLALKGVPIQNLMITRYQTLAPSDPLSTAVDHILDGWQQDFPVLDGDRVAGVLTQQALLSGLTSSGKASPVGDVMVRHFETAAPSEMSQEVFRRLQSSSCRTLPVLQDGHLVGLVSSDNLGEFLMIEKALSRKERR